MGVSGAVAAVLAAAAAALAGACHKSSASEPVGAGPGVVSAPSSTAPGAPRPGMVWIPAGELHAGSAPDEVPRVAEAEMPGVDVPLAGFYIDVLPWPDEPGAIATTDVTREEAARLCESKGKRLCTELEWERACKGPDNARFEYGASYDARACGAGAPADSSARRPTGERMACKSGFGVRDMHGEAWEWTDSRWSRGAPAELGGLLPDGGRAAKGPGGGREVGVVRGGNDTAGELATRCAFARPMAAGERSPSVGFRCCAGPRNDAEVQVTVKTGPVFERTAQPNGPSPPLDALGGVACGTPMSPAPCFGTKAWTWRPEANVELSIRGGCTGKDPNARCAIAVSRAFGDRVETLAQIDCGRQIPEVVQVAGPDHDIRVRGANVLGQYFREVSFHYGRLEVRPVR